AQAELGQPVQEDLEQAGVGAVGLRGGDQQHVGGADRVQRVGDVPPGVGGQQRRAEAGQVDGVRLGLQAGLGGERPGGADGGGAEGGIRGVVGDEHGETGHEAVSSVRAAQAAKALWGRRARRASVRARARSMEWYRKAAPLGPPTALWTAGSTARGAGGGERRRDTTGADPGRGSRRKRRRGRSGRGWAPATLTTTQ